MANALLISIVIAIMLIIVTLSVSMIYVPYNRDITGEWLYGEKERRVWFSYTKCGNYKIYDILDEMKHVGTLKVDRLFNLNKYDLDNAEGVIKCIVSTERMEVCVNNSKMEIVCNNEAMFTKN